MWRLGPAQGCAMNRVRVGRQQLSVECTLCRSQLGRHTERPVPVGRFSSQYALTFDAAWRTKLEKSATHGFSSKNALICDAFLRTKPGNPASRPKIRPKKRPKEKRAPEKRPARTRARENQNPLGWSRVSGMGPCFTSCAMMCARKRLNSASCTSRNS